MRAGGEVLVAAPAAPALGDHNALVRLLEVVHQLARLGVVERRAHRHLQRDRPAIQPGAVRAHAVLAALRLVLRVVAEMNQRVVALARLHDDVAAAPAVAARGPPARHKLLAPEGHAAVAAVAGLHANFGFINEHAFLPMCVSPAVLRPRADCAQSRSSSSAVFSVYRTVPPACARRIRYSRRSLARPATRSMPIRAKKHHL